MNKRKLIFVGLILTLFLLTGCGPVIKITGQIVDQHGHAVRGVRISSSGAKAETNAQGRFTLTIPDVEYSTYVTLVIDGSHLGFQKREKSLQIFPGLDISTGDISINRIKALVTGSVTNTYTTDSMSLLAAPAPLATLNGPAYPEGEVLIKFKETVEPQSIKNDFNKLKVEVLSELPKSKILRIKTEGNTMETIEALKKRSDVEFVEPNYYVYPLGTVQPTSFTYCDDPYYTDQWNLQAINIENAWSYGARGDSNVKVAVLDTGIKRGIGDLDSRILWELGRDIVDDDYDPSVFWDSHGTYVASIIAARPDNNWGIAGINYDVSIVPIRILRDENDCWGTTEELIRGMEWAIFDADVDIINLSLAINITGYSNVRAVDEMIDLAEAEGILIIAAAGNDKQNSPVYPASNSKVISVGAVGRTLQPASYSAKNVDIYAPGGDYYTYPVTNANGIRVLGSEGVTWVQGTSYASAHVAGVAALMLADNPYLTPWDLRYRLLKSSLYLAYDDGAGLVDAYRAVTNEKHGRIFVFFGTESYNQFNYDIEESTYTYQKAGSNFFQLSDVNPGYNRHLYAWADRDANGKLSFGDLFSESILTIDEGDEIDIELILHPKYY